MTEHHLTPVPGNIKLLLGSPSNNEPLLTSSQKRKPEDNFPLQSPTKRARIENKENVAPVTRKTALEGVKIAFHELEQSLKAMDKQNEMQVRAMEEEIHKEKVRRISANMEFCRSLAKMEEQAKKDAEKLRAYEEEIAELKKINDHNMSRTALWRKIGIIASSPSAFANEKSLEDIDRVIETRPRVLPRRSLPIKAVTDSVL